MFYGFYRRVALVEDISAGGSVMTALHLNEGVLAVLAHQPGQTVELMSGVAADLTLPGSNRLESFQ